jgi:hypothetical protein
MEAGDDHDSGGTMSIMRDTNQSKAYAARRANQAVDELINATSDAERTQAQVWVRLWGALAGYSQTQPSDDRGGQFAKRPHC